jgi:serine protease
MVLILKLALLLVFVRGIADKRKRDCHPLRRFWSLNMSGIRSLLAVLAIGGTVNLWCAAARAAIPEWNAVRTHSVQLGPEAGRLLVGFRATDGNATVKVQKSRARPQGVKLIQANTSEADASSLAVRTGLAMARSRQVTPSMHVLYLQKVIYGSNVNAMLKRLRADPAVQFAEVDQRRYPHALPDDPLFVPSSGASGQWYLQTPSSATITLGGVASQDLSATDAVSAWAITTGSTGTVIADVDTGVRFDHPDLLRAGFGGRLLPGYDFVDQDYSRTSPYNALGTFLMANDGDGWDPDPSDPGDWINSTDQKSALFPASDCRVADSSWHGTRVAGVLGALTNNGTGVAGMTWNPYILPVRALGKCGGYDSDIIAGMNWAAGLTVSGVPDNPYPADIINLSLGGSGSCGSDYQSVFDTLTTMGVLVVVSAGNETGPVDSPGNCNGVLAVVGLRNVGTKVGYSSFGPEAGIAAPAGNCVTDSGPCYRSIDTTTNLGLTTPGANSFTNETNPNLGTSFSAPIVSGIAALMRAVNANLTPPQLIARLKSSAIPFPQPAGLPVCPKTAVDASGVSTGECACPNDGSQCGAGMVNALQAVSAALAPIAVIATNDGATFDASGSVAACNLTVTSYAWSTQGGITIQGAMNGPQVTVTSSGAGTLKLTVTDSAKHVDASATVSFNASGVATVNAPSSAGTAATACPTPLNVMPAPPAVAQSFSPASVGENVASTLTITFSNTNGFALTQSAFAETPPGGLVIQTSPAPTTTCSGASGTLTSSSSSVAMAGANIPANGSCSMTMSVKSASAGTYTNSIAADALTTAPAGNNSVSVSTSLTVTAPPGKSGGGAFDWWDMLFVAGVLLAGRRHMGRRPMGRRAAR